VELPIEHEILRCPNCGGEIDAQLRCAGCGTRFTEEGGVYNLLPRDVDATKQHEDEIFAEGSRELRSLGERTWRLILGRHQVLQVLRFDEELVDMFPAGRFLELGGGTCFGAAIYKSLHPDCPVYASDVSPNTLRNAAIPSSRFFTRRPDVFAAMDAENLPFKDGTIDALFAMTMMHHLPQPERMLRQVERVLAPGGRFVAVDHCVPPHFRWLFSRTASRRAGEYDIQEELLSYERWRAIVRAAGWSERTLRVYSNPRYLPDPVFALAGRLVHRLPASVTRRLFPVGMVVVFDKPA
jgi:SAM-dependent methyltransferase